MMLISLSAGASARYRLAAPLFSFTGHRHRFAMPGLKHCHWHVDELILYFSPPLMRYRAWYVLFSICIYRICCFGNFSLLRLRTSVLPRRQFFAIFTRVTYLPRYGRLRLALFARLFDDDAIARFAFCWYARVLRLYCAYAPAHARFTGFIWWEGTRTPSRYLAHSLTLDANMPWLFYRDEYWRGDYDIFTWILARAALLRFLYGNNDYIEVASRHRRQRLYTLSAKIITISRFCTDFWMRV